MTEQEYQRYLRRRNIKDGVLIVLGVWVLLVVLQFGGAIATGWSLILGG